MSAPGPSPNARRALLFVISVAAGALIYLGFTLGKRSGPGPGGETPSSAVPWTPALFRVSLEPAVDGWRAAGSTKLPEGAEVVLDLAFRDPGGPGAAERTATVAGGRLEARFGSRRGTWPSGRYFLRARPPGGRPVRIAEAEHGDPETAVEEMAAVRLHYLRCLREADDAVRDLLAAADEAREGETFLDGDGSFIPAAWRAWTDEEFGGSVRVLDRWQASLGERFAVPVLPAVARRAEGLIDALKGLADRTTVDVFARHEMSPPPGVRPGPRAPEVLDALAAVTLAAGLEGVDAPAVDCDEILDLEGVRVRFVRRGDAHRMRIEGTLPVPHGAHTTVELRYHDPDGVILASAPADRPHFRLRLESSGRTIPAGTYHLRMALDARSQPPEVRQRIEEAFPDLADGWTREVSFEVGAAFVAAEEDRRVVHYQEMLVDASRLFWETKATLVRAARQEAHVLEGGALDLPALQAWKEESDGAMKELVVRHEAFRAETLAAKYEQEDQRISRLLTLIARERDAGLADLAGRDLDANEPFRPLAFRQQDLTKLVRDDICPGIGLPPVTLGSLRLGEAKRAERANDPDRALEIYLQLGDPSVEEPGVEARALVAAAEIHVGAGREWLALPLLLWVTEEKRYAGLQDTIREALKLRDEIEYDAEPFAPEKEESYRAYVQGLVDTIARAIEDGRHTARRHGIEDWYVHAWRVQPVFGLRVPAGEGREALERLIGATTESFTVPSSLQNLARLGRLDEVLRTADEAGLPLAEKLAGRGVPDAILGWSDAASERALDRAGRSFAIHGEVRALGIEIPGMIKGGRVALFRVPGEEEPLARYEGQEIHAGVKVAGIRARDGGWTVTLEMPDGRRAPFWVPGEE